MADFVDALARVNDEADRHRGFVWRLQTGEGNSLGVRAFEDDAMLFNLSVWTSMADLFEYTYKSVHGEFFRRRREWFLKPPRDPVVMWWIPAGRTPSVRDAEERFGLLWGAGSRPDAFTFRAAFDPAGNPLPEDWRRAPMLSISP